LKYCLNEPSCFKGLTWFSSFNDAFSIAALDDRAANNKLRVAWMLELVVIKVLSQHFRGGTKEHEENLRAGNRT
jgi:hypothetical protein